MNLTPLFRTGCGESPSCCAPTRREAPPGGSSLPAKEGGADRASDSGRHPVGKAPPHPPGRWGSPSLRGRIPMRGASSTGCQDPSSPRRSSPWRGAAGCPNPRRRTKRRSPPSSPKPATRPAVGAVGGGRRGRRADLERRLGSRGHRERGAGNGRQRVPDRLDLEADRRHRGHAARGAGRARPRRSAPGVLPGLSRKGLPGHRPSPDDPHLGHPPLPPRRNGDEGPFRHRRSGHRDIQGGSPPLRARNAVQLLDLRLQHARRRRGERLRPELRRLHAAKGLGAGRHGGHLPRTSGGHRAPPGCANM